ncbi:MAG: DUF1553 domain-containing protein [Planctomycetota bacterium]|nr:MAG: DUF1553 domain-containing protein [Planctomycetota bacterium]REJ90065.1 MAG: DUF1553 domain-containing protein [Planctomycetota bacterium]
MSHALRPLFALALIAALPASVTAAELPEHVDFVRDVQPILEASCYDCHAGGTAEGGIRWDRKSAFIGGDSGEVAVEPGQPEESSLIARVRGEDELMPPEDEGEPLSESQIALLERWIEQGAEWPDTAQAVDEGPRHWSLIKPEKHALPTTAHQDWVRNSIDPFVAARMEAEGLKPSPEADRYTLVRRLYLDIIGIPPTLDQVDRFVNDPRPDAYERLVDRLLDSRHYGERWARMWLDLARYADTQGYEKDNRRTIHRYRDWVIGAFNRDLPFDRFTIEQMAGDMLPVPTTEQYIATAFHRNTMTNTEGGTDDEEFRSAAVVDRVNTTGQVWLGLTVGCAQCHSHKYDPITQREYYELYAFLNQTADNDQPNEAPVLSSPLGEVIGEIDALLVKIAKQKRALAEYRSAELAAAQTAWATQLAEQGPSPPPKLSTWQFIGPFVAESYGAALSTSFPPEQEIDLTQTYDDGQLRWEAKPEYVDNKVHELSGDYSSFYFYRTIEASVPGPLDLSFGSDDSIKVWLNGRVVHDKQIGRSAFPDQDRISVQLRQGENQLLVKIVNATGKGGFFFRALGGELPKNVVEIAQKSPESRTTDEQDALAAYYRTIAPLLKPLRDQLFETESRLQSLRAKSGGPTTPIMLELEDFKRRETHVMVRGSFLTKGPRVEPGVPASLHPFPEDVPRNRLGLAYWLVDKNNPLTARVMVNRFWEQMFGRGLVATSEDFGTQGVPPTHPELLDRLAIEFMEQGWSMKKLVKHIAMSATYRQSSHTTPALMEKDPENRWLARGPRFRLEAEMVRDQALASSGLLSRKMFGKSVMPPQPPGVWQVVYSGDKWETSVGEDRYRRGLYTFWRRTSPYPSMIAFDATSREICTVKRTRTNTPLAALVTLNDPVYVEAAQALARRVVEDGGSNLEDRVTFAFRRCLVRPPRAAELNRIVALYETELAHYRQHPEEAKQMATDVLGEAPAEMDVVELAAWTVVANVLLNLDETLTKG